MSKIRITKNGPYLVTGNISLGEMIILPTKNGNIYKEGRTFPSQEEYALCRCGKSKNKPFCDGSHHSSTFDGTLTASKELITNYATKYESPNLILEDAESLCAFARFCHNKSGDIWTLLETAENKKDEKIVIEMANNCPSGRLVIVDKKTKTKIEPVFEKSIMLLQDPSRKCSGPLWVRGGILIEDETGAKLETRNQVTLCRCGRSSNKPFCDASHVNSKFNDGGL